MRNCPRGVEGRRAVRTRPPARSGWPTTCVTRILGMGGGNGTNMVGLAAAAIIVTFTRRGDQSLLCCDGLQPLHSRPIQALSRPLPRIPFWL